VNRRTGLAVAAVAGLITAGGLSAVPVSAAVSPAAAASATAAATSLPAVWPTPRQIQAEPGSSVIPPSVGEVVGAGTDPAALSALGAVLRADGVRQITRATAGQPAPDARLVFYVGTPAVNAAVDPELRRLGVQGPEGLPAGGYVLAAGQPAGTAGTAVVLAGTDGAGTFYAVQTLRQLIVAGSGVTGQRGAGGGPTGHGDAGSGDAGSGDSGSGAAWIRNVQVRDWPSAGLRGVIEGFYGPAWTDAEIGTQLRFYGQNKLNTFVYSAKSDPYLRADWQDPYPSPALASLGQLVSAAQSEHVNFVYALSPGLSICYSSGTDLSALEAKDQQLWNAGVRQFALFFDDIGSGFNCAADTARFGSSPDPLAAAQAYLINNFVTGFIGTHPGADELITVPTNYAGDAASAYRSVWKASLTSRVLVYWTGVGVIPQTITAAQASATAAEFGQQIVVWDNYPVNDYDPTRLFLGPLTGRAADLSTAVAGFTSNPMQEPAPSTIPLFTTADYTWNPAAYTGDPGAAWQAGIGHAAAAGGANGAGGVSDVGGANGMSGPNSADSAESADSAGSAGRTESVGGADGAGGSDGAALSVFAADNQSVPRIGTPEAPALTALISAFWSAYGADQGPAITPALRTAAGRLLAAWQQIAAAPPQIAAQATEDAQAAGDAFAREMAPWLGKFRFEGLAGGAAVRMLLDTKAGDTRAASAQRSALTAFYAQAAGIPVVVGQGVFNPFLLRADPSLFTRAVRLYAATASDYSAALAAVRAAGLPASQVTRSFAITWDEASDGEYLVIAVGAAADDGLYYNTCGWTNPSGQGGGFTPFSIATAPLDTLPGTNYYENGTAATTAQTPQLATDLAYYAAHGRLPVGVTALPAAARPAGVCSGQPAP
jgi:hyaluronoglucosaminidase